MVENDLPSGQDPDSFYQQLDIFLCLPDYVWLIETGFFFGAVYIVL